MATKIMIPTPLRAYTNKQDVVELTGETVGDLLATLTGEYTALRKHLMTEDGKLRSFVNIYLNDDDIRYLQNEQTRVSQNDVVSIIPSIAGGRA
jgi:molybdopterin converting factor small subunit